MSKVLGKSIVAGLIGTLVMTVFMLMAPMMGAGLFAVNTHAPMAMVMGSLMGHLVYGAVLGGVYGTRNLAPASVVGA